MAGIYVHIPFCKSRCVYCGFYSTTRLEWRQRYVDAVCREWLLRRDYLKESVRTLYIGGGTPSQLTVDQLRQLFDALTNGLSSLEEVTIECNPDDVTAEYAEALSQLPVNRVSMGAQTFDDNRLRFLHRRHTAAQIPQAVERLRKAGIANISIDLMYGFPDETIDDWHRDIEAALLLDVEHLSAYALMYEEGTLLYRLLEQGRVKEVDEELSRRMYYDLIDRLTAAGYEHYEISNFARKEEGGGLSRKEERGGKKEDSFRSRHNSNYWNQTSYIGLGAAAHSFDGESRQWNVDDVERYMAGVESGSLLFEREELDEKTRYNDLVMTALRTCEGLDLALLTDSQRSYCLQQAERYVADGLLIYERNHRDANEKGRLRLSRRGLFVSDMMMSDLMLV